ncbi:hypothetical protein AMTRI_Chr05g60050 [Amborella trichopoda]
MWRMEEVGEDDREGGGERKLGEKEKGEDERDRLGEKGQGVKKKKGLFQKIKDGFKKMLVFKSKKNKKKD